MNIFLSLFEEDLYLILCPDRMNKMEKKIKFIFNYTNVTYMQTICKLYFVYVKIQTSNLQNFDFLISSIKILKI